MGYEPLDPGPLYRKTVITWGNDSAYSKEIAKVMQSSLTEEIRKTREAKRARTGRIEKETETRAGKGGAIFWGLVSSALLIFSGTLLLLFL